MKSILIKYLQTNDEYKDIVKEILASKGGEKEIFEIALKTNDPIVKELYEIINVGVVESIDRLKESSNVVTHFSNVIKDLNQIQKYAVVESDINVMPKYLSILEENRYEDSFNKEYKAINEKLGLHKRKMALAHFYLTLEGDKTLNKRLNEAKEILFDMIVEDSETNESRFLNISESLTFHNTILQAKSYIENEKASLHTKGNEFSVKNVTGIYERTDENVLVLHTEGRTLILEEETNIRDINEEDDLELSNEFKNLSKLLDKGVISVSETINIHANKLISINDETKAMYVDGKEVKVFEDNIPFTLIHKHGIDKKYIPTFEYVYENTDKFISFDNAKKIEHRNNSNLNVVIFRINESLFSFKNNKKLAVKYVTESYQPTELRDDIKEFINFDIAKDIDLLEDLFIQESNANKRRKEILAQIEKLEQELEKIETAETEENLEDESLEELKEIIKTNIEQLREEYVNESGDLEGYIEVEIKNKKGVYWVEALEYTQASKTQELKIKDDKGHVFTERKSNVKPIED